MLRCFYSRYHMLLKIVLIVSFALVEETCFGRITIETPKQSQLGFQLIDATVQVLSSCYEKRASTIGVHGDPTGILFGALLSKQSLPVIAIDIPTNVSRNDSLRHEPPNKLQLFAITANSTTQLQEILLKIKKSRWWNHMASILILDWVTETDHGCSNAFEFLWAAWQMDLINANYFCINQTNKISMYTYNPYTNKAPTPWKLEKTFKGHWDHPWSMFVQEYQEDKKFCEGFHFDKTSDLGGYKVSAIIQEDGIFWELDRSKKGLDSFGGYDGFVAQRFFRAMNANVALEINNHEEFIKWNKKGEVSGFVVNVMKGINDISLMSHYQQSLSNQTTTYPYWYSGLGVVTQKMTLSHLSKMTFLIRNNSSYCLYAILLITILCLKIFGRKSVAFAILDTLRLICNSGILTMSNMTSAKIYLTALFFFQITILPLFQGQLTSLQTRETGVKNIDTMDDLIDSHRLVHANNDLGQVLMASGLDEENFFGQAHINCLEFASDDSSAACVSDWDELSDGEMPLNVHVSDDPVMRLAVVFAIRKNWPPEERLNKILQRMFETDIVRRGYTVDTDEVFSANKLREKSNAGPKVTTLNDLSFAFAVLGVGLISATVTFIIEIIVAAVRR